MIHHASPAFWSLYRALSDEVRALADGSFAKLKADPRHPSLHFKKVGRFWSVRVSRQHRALATEVDDGLVWFWIGTHAELTTTG